MPKVDRVPAYKLHKPTGQARVIIRGRHYYLGLYGSPESREKYGRLIAEFAVGREPPATGSPTTSTTLLVLELAAHYWKFAQTYYVKDGRPSGHLQVIKQGLRALRELYSTLRVSEFGPLKLQAIQKRLIDGNKSRAYINHVVGTIRRVFKWGVSQEIVPPSVYHGLLSVSGLKKGRSAARETDPVLPVDDEVVDATLPFLPPVVEDMVRFQRLTGARPGEVCSLRPMDLDRSGDVWAYRPAGHKMEHLGRERVVWIGPQAQLVLLPYLLRSAEAFCFSPAESDAKRKAEMRAARKTKVQPSQLNRRKSRPKRRPRDRYIKDSYRRAVRRAVDLANRKREKEAEQVGKKFKEEDRLPRWHPNQLRHSVATKVRKSFGLEGAQVVLGHAKADVTQVYAERDGRLAAEIMKKIG